MLRQTGTKQYSDSTKMFLFVLTDSDQTQTQLDKTEVLVTAEK